MARVEFNGRQYVLEVKDANHGFMHWHEDAHEDGTPGQPAHHHHDAKCEWLPAMLKPVEPAEVPIGTRIHITEVQLDRLYEKES